MKKTPFIQKILSILSALTLLPLLGNMALAGIDITYPGAGVDLDQDNDLIPQGSSSDNTVTVLDGDIRYVYGGKSDLEAVINNTVTISGGTINGDIYGGDSWQRASTGNTVTILNGTILKYIYGGYSEKSTVAGNIVTVSGGIISGIIFGGRSNEGSVTGNTITISSGTINNNIYGGYSRDIEAKGNTVTISGGTIKGDIYGGSSQSGSATGNTVILSGGTISEAIFGGYSGSANADAFSGNKLILDDFQGTVSQISNFEFIEISSSGKEGDMLVLSGGHPTDLTRSQVSIHFTGISHSYNAGDKITLIKNEAGITLGSGSLLQKGQQQVQGTAYIWDLIFDSDDTSIYATVLSEKFNERSKALAEGRVAAIAHLNLGAELIAGQGMSQAIEGDQSKGKIKLFSAMAATNSQYATGSHIDLYGYSALVGASIAPAALPSLKFGVFGESGWGHYGSFSDFADGAVRGSGSTEYYGGGLLTHYDLAKSGLKGISLEASFRAGKTEMDYQSGDLSNAKYKLSTPYYGLHTGVNYTGALSSKLKSFHYARFLWSHLDGDNANIEGSDFRFRTMDSQRIQAGSRISYELNSCISPYADLSYEWECSGTARAVVDGVNGMSAPSLRGGTGTGELGATWKPMAQKAFWVDFSAQGHVGERQGVSGMIRVNTEF